MYLSTLLQVPIPGIPNAGYEGGNRNPGAINKLLLLFLIQLIFYITFLGKKIQMQKLKKMRENDGLKDLLASKFDREIITQLLNIDRIDLDEILRNCNYSDTFIKDLMTYKFSRLSVDVTKNTEFYNSRNLPTALKYYLQ